MGVRFASVAYGNGSSAVWPRKCAATGSPTKQASTTPARTPAATSATRSRLNRVQIDAQYPRGGARAQPRPGAAGAAVGVSTATSVGQTQARRNGWLTGGGALTSARRRSTCRSPSGRRSSPRTARTACAPGPSSRPRSRSRRRGSRPESLVRTREHGSSTTGRLPTKTTRRKRVVCATLAPARERCGALGYPSATVRKPCVVHDSGPMQYLVAQRG